MLQIAMAFIMEILHIVLRPIITFQPLLSRAEVYKCAVSHYFSFTRIQRDIGYYPIVPYADAMQLTVQFYRARYAKPSAPLHPPSSLLHSACSRPAWLIYALLLAMLTYIAQLRWSSPVA